MLGPERYAAPSIPCHAREAMPFPQGSAVLATPGAKEIPPHIKRSWGGLLTWILLSVFWLQQALLPNSTRPRWFLPQTGEGIRASHSQGRQASEKTPIWGTFGMAHPNMSLGSFSLSSLVCRPELWVSEWRRDLSKYEFGARVRLQPHPQFRAHSREGSQKVNHRTTGLCWDLESLKYPCYSAYLLLKWNI